MRIAIVKLSALGDIVHAMVALQFVKQAIPDIHIDWVVEQGLAGVLQGNPDIDRILTVNLKALKQNKRLIFREIGKIRRYAENRYDLVIDAQGLIKSALTARLLAPDTAGFDQHSIREKAAALFYRQRVGIPYDANTIDRNAAVIARPLGLEISRQQIMEKKPFLFYRPMATHLETFFSPTKANIVFVIGSTWPSRNYPREKYLRVIDALQDNGLICWGNEQERLAAEWIAARTPHARVMPKMDLNDLKAVLDRAELVVGNDTGPTHMAWGLNRPSITLFGPTPVSRVYQTPINKVLKSSSQVDSYKLNKNDFSIGEINENDIVAMAKSLLAANEI
ncbi:lipopolysaccharide heptosyltransferase I [Methylomarinum vadi]|uniref:lipopolysaccharide heptosyltransferase I n=1 Tax=Methylomarinum vadi TaxID=438855 RepID=UPI0004DF7346|nr:lipopolysaccharide heptosyltransferase I [Methylomarinum vadi]